jgi:phosphopantothenate-cysteine ligase
MPTHKIQSRDSNELQLTLSLVPKTLERLVKKVVPNAYVVSFKLETDERLLLQKAQFALKQYGHHVVIGNLLETRKRHVLFAYPDGNSESVSLSDEDLNTGVEIESLIVTKLCGIHKAFIDANGSKQQK